MKRIIFLIMLCILSISLTGCVSYKSVEISGDVIQKEFKDLEGDKLSIRRIMLKNGNVQNYPTLEVIEGEEKKIVIEAQESFFEHITVKEEIKTISISGILYERYLTKDVSIKIYGYTFDDVYLACVNGTLDSKTLTDNVMISLSNASKLIVNNDKNYKDVNLSASGASYLIMNANTTFTNMNLNVSGASKVEFENVNATKIKANVSGASFLNAKGLLNELKANISGASKATLFDLNVYDADLNVSGASTVELSVRNNLAYDLSGASRLKYKGNPTITDNDVSGASIATKED